MEDAIAAAQGARGRQCPPVADSAARRRRIGVADRVRQRCESSTRARQHERTRSGGSAGTGASPGRLKREVVTQSQPPIAPRGVAGFAVLFFLKGTLPPPLPENPP